MIMFEDGRCGGGGWSVGRLVEVLAALDALAQTLDLVVLLGKLVVVGQLLAAADGALCEDDDVLVALDEQHAADAVRLA